MSKHEPLPSIRAFGDPNQNVMSAKTHAEESERRAITCDAAASSADLEGLAELAEQHRHDAANQRALAEQYRAKAEELALAERSKTSAGGVAP